MGYFKRLWWFIAEEIEEFILVALIIMNVIDFIGALSPTLDFLKKIISWSLLATLMFRASFSKILFGVRRWHFDLLLIVGYFALIFKNISHSSASIIREMAHRPTSYWAEVYRVDSLPADVQALPMKIEENAINISNMDSLFGNSLNQFIDKVTVEFNPLPTLKSVFVNISNNQSSQLVLVEPKYAIHGWLNFFQEPGLLEWSIFFGSILLIVVSIYACLSVRIERPSLMSAIQEEGPPPEGIAKKFIRFLIILFVVNFIFVVLFNLVMEWFALGVDTPIALIGVLFYVIVWIKYHKRFEKGSIVFRIGSFGENILEKIVESFHTKKGLMLGVSGMLVLHLFTDIGNFIIPYITGFMNPLYFSHLGGGHEPIFNVLSFVSEDETSLVSIALSSAGNIIDRFNIIYIYSMNIIGLILLMFIPSYLWYMIFMGREKKLSRLFIFLFFASVLVYLLAPVFTITRIPGDNKELVGVDILTHEIPELHFDMIWIAVVSIACGASFFALSFFFRKYVTIGIILGSMVFFVIYIFFFFSAITNYYVGFIKDLIGAMNFFLAPYFLIFLMITYIFYVSGILIFFYFLVFKD